MGPGPDGPMGGMGGMEQHHMNGSLGEWLKFFKWMLGNRFCSIYVEQYEEKSRTLTSGGFSWKCLFSFLYKEIKVVLSGHQNESK